MKRRHPTQTAPFDELEDDLLIEQSLAGNPVAWSALIARYEPLIYSIPLRYGMSQSQAADVFQEVCLILLEKLEQLRDPQRLAAWLGTTTRRECWRISQRQDAASPSDPEPVLARQWSSFPSPDAIVEEWEACNALHSAIARLDQRCRALLERLYFNHPTPNYAELAEEFDMPIGSIGPTRARCLKKLHRLMGGKRYREKP